MSETCGLFEKNRVTLCSKKKHQKLLEDDTEKLSMLLERFGEHF